MSKGLVSDEQLREGMAFQRNGGITLGEALIRLGHVDEATVARADAKANGLPFVDVGKGRVTSEILAKVPEEWARDQGLLPVMEKGGKLVVAIDDPMKRIVADQLSFQVGQDVICALTTKSALAEALTRYYGAPAASDDLAQAMQGDADDKDDAPIIRLVSRTLKEALNQRASDVHIEPMGGALRVRLRVDGVLRETASHPLHLAAPLVSRLKIMGSMDIAEKRKPQDGRISVTIDGRQIDVRASILPSNHGESIVLRLLDRSANLLGLRDLGFDDEDYAWFKRLILKPHGIVLVTGPTGSGKTTTLYAALSELNRPDVKILTAEDPVEYHISGINQVQVAPKIGLSFARILKAMLRAAPNIILVGEIRDLETAEVAVQAALTGHLVFSTLHTNDAASAITRLGDMGVQKFLVSSSVQGIIAQRLVRRICSNCVEEYVPEEAEFRVLGLDPTDLAGRTFARGKGCGQCGGTGYRGRLGLYELLDFDVEFRDAIFRGENLEELKSQAIGRGLLRPLVTAGARKVLAHLTTVNEIMRVTRSAEEA